MHNLYILLIFTTAVTIFSLSIVLFLGGKMRSARIFSLCTLTIALWTAGCGFLELPLDDSTSIFLDRLTLYLGQTIALMFMFFLSVYPNNNKIKLRYWIPLIIMQIIFAYIFIFTNTIVTGLNPENHYDWVFGTYSFIFDITFSIYFLIGIIILITNIKKTEDPIKKTNLRLMLFVIFIGLAPACIFSVILPRFSIYSFNWIAAFSQVIWVPLIVYSIIKYGQMNIKIILTEALAIGMTAIFFINIFTSFEQNLWMRTFTFLVFLILAYYLIRTSLNETRQKEQLASINSLLEQKVAEQTKEIKDAYDLEKRARRDLEKLNETKDQFIMITQHHLRTPVTSIKWELENIYKGEHGKIQPKLQTSLDRVNSANNRLMKIVEDFLSITAIKVGTPILNFLKTDMKSLLDDVCLELKDEISARNISVSGLESPPLSEQITIDSSKIREVLLIIMENAIRYNQQNGTIKIESKILGDNIYVHITNTGVGITQDEHKKLFGALFYRGERAKKAHPIGMGIGLSVAKAISQAHKGNLFIESQGENRGAKVTLELPLNQLYSA